MKFSQKYAQNKAFEKRKKYIRRESDSYDKFSVNMSKIFYSWV